MHTAPTGAPPRRLRARLHVQRRYRCRGDGASSGSSSGGGAGGVAYSFRHHPLPLAGRRLLQHPTRPAYLILCGVEHRSHGRQEVEQHREEDLAFLKARTDAAAASKRPEEALMLYGGIPYTAPQRSLGRPNTYHSVLQLYHQGAQRLLPPIYFEPQEVITAVAVGSFFKEFGREPVVIVGTASMYTHGAGCGTAATWKQGFLRTFRCSSGGGGGVSGSGSVDSAQAGPLRLELFHSTYLRPDGAAEGGGGSGTASHPMLNAEAVAAEARPDYASALCVCEEVGLLFVGMGSAQGLRIYSCCKEQLLRRRHLAHTPGQRINAIDYVFASPPGSRNGNAYMTSFDAGDLYQCPYGDEHAQRLAREKQLLIVCGTVDASVFIAALQPGSSSGGGGGATTPSFLMQIIADRVPRHITCLAVMDERTIAAADRFGTVVFLRIPESTRTKFAQPVSQLKEAELLAEEAYLRTQQTFVEVARHHTGQLVTALRVQPYDPSQGTDRSLATRILYYATALGSVGAFLPFVQEEDGAVAAYAQPLLQAHLRPLLSPPTMLPPSSMRCHHVVDGDVVQQLLRSGVASAAAFSPAAREAVEEALERQVRMEAARRNVLGLPKRRLPSLAELVAKQRALLTLPL
jgi:splicing factor 3B subunit 3